MTQEEQTYATRRAATRAPVGKAVQLHFDDTLDILEGVCDNISIGGMFVELNPPRPPSTLVRFELPVENGSICGLGEVVWMRSESLGKDRAAGMGIKFRHLEQRDRQLIFKLVSEHIKERLARRQALTAPFALPEPELRRAAEKARRERAHSSTAPGSTTDSGDDFLDKTLQRGPASSPNTGSVEPATSKAAISRATVPEFDPPIGKIDEADRTLQRSVQTHLFDSQQSEPDPVDKTFHHPLQPPSEEIDPLDKTIHRPGLEASALGSTTVEASRFEASRFEVSGAEASSVEAGSVEASSVEANSGLFAARPEPIVTGAFKTGSDDDSEAVDKTLQHASRPDYPAVPLAGEAEPDGLDRTLSRSTRIDASRLPRRRRKPWIWIFVALLLLLGVGGYLLRGAWLGEDGPQAEGFPSSEITPPTQTETAVSGSVSSSPPASASAEPTATTEPETESANEAAEDARSEAVLPERTTPPPPTPGSNASFSRLIDIQWQATDDGILLTIEADGRIPSSRYKHFRLGGQSGPREVIQFLGVKKSFGDRVIQVDSPEVDQIRTGYHRKRSGNELHVVLDLDAARYRVREISNRGNRLEISVH